MSLSLDSRQRAMLQEMGVRVWSPDWSPLLPEPVEAEAPVNAPVNRLPERVQAAPPARPDPRSVNESAPRPDAEPTERFSVLTPAPKVPAPPVLPTAANNWTELKQTVQNCQACAMCEGRRSPVLAAPPKALPCDWMVVGEPPDEVQERLGYPFVGEAGQLLDKMLKAAGTQRYPGLAGQAANEPLEQAPAAQRAYLTHVLKCRPAQVRAPVAAELTACAAHLRREISLVQPKVIVSMGRFAMQVLLSDMPPEQVKLPLGKLRGRVWRFAGVPVVVTYPPDYLLGAPQDKAKAWADLQLAMAVVRGEA